MNDKKTNYNDSRVLKRRRRKKLKARLIFSAAVLFLILAVSAAVVAVCILADSDDDESRDVLTDESKITDVSSDASNDISDESSKEEVSDTESEEPSDEPEISYDEPISTIEAYEKYIGVKYAVDMTKYEEYVDPEDSSEFLILVNASNPLPKDYVPKNMVKCSNIRPGRPVEWGKINKTANLALEAFLLEAKAYGIKDVTVANAYRSYSSQSGLFNNYLNRDLANDYVCKSCDEYIDMRYEKDEMKNGKCAKCGGSLRRPTKDEATAHVKTYSSYPGTSEHQSGLCVDMHNLETTNSNFNGTPEAKWLAANAHRFGFILRYPEGTQHITGIKHESWHFRFVGRDAATEMFEKGLTLEEYLA